MIRAFSLRTVALALLAQLCFLHTSCQPTADTTGTIVSQGAWNTPIRTDINFFSPTLNRDEILQKHPDAIIIETTINGEAKPLFFDFDSLVGAAQLESYQALCDSHNIQDAAGCAESLRTVTLEHMVARLLAPVCTEFESGCLEAGKSAVRNLVASSSSRAAAASRAEKPEQQHPSSEELHGNDDEFQQQPPPAIQDADSDSDSDSSVSMAKLPSFVQFERMHYAGLSNELAALATASALAAARRRSSSAELTSQPTTTTTTSFTSTSTGTGVEGGIWDGSLQEREFFLTILAGVDDAAIVAAAVRGGGSGGIGDGGEPGGAGPEGDGEKKQRASSSSSSWVFTEGK